MITSAEMRALEKNSEFFGVSVKQLMENAGSAVAAEMQKKFSLKGKKIVVVCGQGNNGGDGFVIARKLLDSGFDVKVVFLGLEWKLSEEAKENFEKLPKEILHGTHELDLLKDADILVDAMLGFGAKGGPREPIASAIVAFNSTKGKKIAVDVPSGLNADTGDGNLVAKADIIYTFHDLKPGLQKFRTKTKVLPIGIPEDALKFVGPGELINCLKERPAASHKGQNGKVLVVAGSMDYVGAATLAATAALGCLRSGIDLVTVAAPEKVAYAINAYSPDLITMKMPGDYLSEKHFSEIFNKSAEADVVLIGPGLGQRKETVLLVKKLVKRLKKPVVLDADAIKAVVGIRFGGNVLITPHAKEFQICFGKSLSHELQKNAQLVQKTAKQKKCIILLKGAIDIISDGKKLRFNKTGNAGMTIGGTGDVLAGLCAGFLSKGNSLFDSACAAAFLNGFIGDELKKEKDFAFIASDIVQKIPEYIVKFKKPE